MSWVTPLGSGVDSVWERLLEGASAEIEVLENGQTGARYLVHRVPPEATKNLPVNPRLRRASAISRFAAVAGLGALADAKEKPDLARTALVFAISNGGVIYTRRFFAEIVKSGAPAASPLLFPETVFNAPASHLAAILAIEGASYTVVGDGAVGILALKLADDLLESPEIDACLVVGAEEVDSLVCEAYRQWRLLRDPEKPASKRGLIPSEGAGAVLLQTARGDYEISRIDAGTNFFRRSEAGVKLRRIIDRLGTERASCCIGSGNGTFIDTAEKSAIPEHVRLYYPKAALGDSIGASVLWQLIVAAQVLRTGRVPTMAGSLPPGKVLVLGCGLNQQMGGLALCSDGEK
jgi:3-oxoacyl-(acyl-carrier-protein) synthase